MTIGRKFEIVRDANRLGYTPMAHALGCTPKFLRKVESGKEAPTEKMIQRMETRFSVKREWLLSEQEQHPKKIKLNQIGRFLDSLSVSAANQWLDMFLYLLSMRKSDITLLSDFIQHYCRWKTAVFQIDKTQEKENLHQLLQKFLQELEEEDT